MKKDIRKWCEPQKIPWHNIDECFSKQSLLAKLKASKLDPDSYSNLEIDKGNQIINVEPIVSITTT